MRDFNRPYFLGVSIGNAAELSPRLALASLPVVAVSRTTSTTVSVDCTAGESIAQAIANAPVGPGLTVTIAGNCNENLVIDRDWMVLDGGGTATLTGITPNSHPGNAVVYLDGARRVEIKGLTIAGPAGDATGMHGVHLALVSSAVLSDGTVVENHDGNGLLIRSRSQADLFDVFVRGNQGNGVYARDGSNVDTRNADIRNNARSGVFLHRRSSGAFQTTVIADNGDQVEELGFCKCALYIDEGSAARMLDGNTFSSNIILNRAGNAVSVYRGSSLRFTDASVIENTSFDASDRDGRTGLALDVGIDSVVRASGGGTLVVRGGISSFNLSTVDLRNVTVEGHIFVFGLDANVRLRDQSGVPDRASLVGDLFLRGGTLSIRRPPNAEAALIDGNVDCSGGGATSTILFKDPDDGYLNCSNVATDLQFSITESADPIAVGGSVIYDIVADNIKRSPAVDALNVVTSFDVSSAGAFTITAADTSTSPAVGSCNILDPGTFDGGQFTGRVECSFDSIRLNAAVARITVSSAQAALAVAGGISSIRNVDDNPSNNAANEITTVQ